MKTNIMAYASDWIDGKVLIAESTGEEVRSNSSAELLMFLLEDWDDPEGRWRYIKACWDLDEFLAPLFRLLGKQVCEQLSAEKHRAVYQGFKLFYIRGKVFGVTARVQVRGNFYQEGEINLYGISQYYTDKDKPETALEVAAYGEDLLRGLERMGLYPTKLTSPVAIYQECVLDHMSIPTVFDLPEKQMEVAEYAVECMDREWRSAYQMGHWDEAFDYDLVAAYPSIAKELGDTRQCKFVKSSNYVRDADWGFAKGKITVEAPISPIMYFDGERYINPIGTWEDIFTLEEVRWLERWHAGTFQIQDGWFLFFDSKAKPFEASLDRLFGYRQTNDLMDRVAKAISIGIYGKFAEEHEDGSYGKYFNPFYAAVVTSRARLKVADFIYENQLQENVVAVNVDGCLVDKFVAVPGKKQMGSWVLADVGPVLVLGAGSIFIGDKKPHGMDYRTVTTAMMEHLRQHYYGVKVRRRQTLWESLQEGVNFADLGKVTNHETSVDLLMLNPDRHFEKMPKTGEQVLNNRYQSKPLEVKE